MITTQTASDSELVAPSAPCFIIFEKTHANSLFFSFLTKRSKRLSIISRSESMVKRTNLETLGVVARGLLKEIRNFYGIFVE